MLIGTSLTHIRQTIADTKQSQLIQLAATANWTLSMSAGFTQFDKTGHLAKWFLSATPIWVLSSFGVTLRSAVWCLVWCGLSVGSVFHEAASLLIVGLMFLLPCLSPPESNLDAHVLFEMKQDVVAKDRTGQDLQIDPECHANNHIVNTHMLAAY